MIKIVVRSYISITGILFCLLLTEKPVEGVYTERNQLPTRATTRDGRGQPQGEEL